MDRRLNQACRPSATPSSRSSLNCHRNDARTVENGLAPRSGVSKSAKVVLVTNAAATGYVQTHTGTLGLNGYSAGGYWTHYGPSGAYLDAVVQGTYYSGNAATQSASLPIVGTGFLASLEAGYPIALTPEPRFVLEPQAQIIWQEVSFKAADDGLGPVALGKTSGLTGRLGLRGVWTIVGENGLVWQPYARANVWRDWGAEATTLFGTDPVPLIEEATRLEFAGGLTAALGGGVSLYAQAGYQFAINSALMCATAFRATSAFVRSGETDRAMSRSESPIEQIAQSNAQDFDI